MLLGVQIATIAGEQKVTKWLSDTLWCPLCQNKGSAMQCIDNGGGLIVTH